MEKAALKRVSQHTGKDAVLLSHLEGRPQFQDGQFRIREFVDDVKELVDFRRRQVWLVDTAAKRVTRRV